MQPLAPPLSRRSLVQGLIILVLAGLIIAAPELAGALVLGIPDDTPVPVAPAGPGTLAPREPLMPLLNPPRTPITHSPAVRMPFIPTPARPTSSAAVPAPRESPVAALPPIVMPPVVMPPATPPGTSAPDRSSLVTSSPGLSQPAAPSPAYPAPIYSSPASPGFTPPFDEPPAGRRRPDQRPARPHPDAPVLDPQTASTQDFITAAQVAIKAGGTHRAIELIDAAQTRQLSRSVTLGTTLVPSNDPQLQTLTQAKQALLNRDRTQALRLLDTALANPPSSFRDQ